MAKEFVTAIVYFSNRVDWASVSRDKAFSGRPVSGSFVMPAPVKEGDIKLKAPDISGVKGDVTLVLPGENVLLKVLSLPSADNDEIRSMAELQIDKLSPFPIETMVTSCEVLKKGNNESTVVVAAVRQDVVQLAGTALALLGIATVRVDAAALAWCRVLQNEKLVPAKGRHLFVVIKGDAPEIIVYHDGLPAIFRTIGGVAGMERSLMDEEIAGEVANTLMSIELELGPAESVGITLVADKSRAEGLSELIQARSMCDVAVKEMDKMQQLAEGAVLRSADPAQSNDVCMDLTPASWRERGASADLKKKIMTYSLAALGLWVVLIAGFSADLFYQKYKLTSLEKQRDELKGPYLEVREMRNKVQTITRYMDRKYSALECFREICLAQPEGIELNNFAYRKSEEISISGSAADVTQVYAFKEKLDTGGFFKETVLTGPIRNKDREDFKLVIRLAGGNR